MPGYNIVDKSKTLIIPDKIGSHITAERGHKIVFRSSSDKYHTPGQIEVNEMFEGHRPGDLHAHWLGFMGFFVVVNTPR